MKGMPRSPSRRAGSAGSTVALGGGGSQGERQPSATEVLLTDADIRKWLPGDNLYDDAVVLPAQMPAGEYDLQVAILDTITGQPKVKLAIAGVRPDGWYNLGKIKVQP